MEPVQHPDENVRKRAERHIWILYGVMILLVLLPFFVWALKTWVFDPGNGPS